MFSVPSGEVKKPGTTVPSTPLKNCRNLFGLLGAGGAGGVGVGRNTGWKHVRQSSMRPLWEKKGGLCSGGTKITDSRKSIR